MLHKIPVSALIVVYTPDLRVLLIERADAPGYWQSVTGSQEPGETLAGCNCSCTDATGVAQQLTG